MNVKSILVLEDELELQSPLSNILAKIYPAAKISCLTTGEEALKSLRQTHGFELVLSDIILPGNVTGIDFWKACQEKFPGTPFCFMSGLPREFYLSMFPDSHPLPGFIAKPFSSRELLDVLTEHLVRSAA
ncbi:MAG: response regulator [Oligoflexia bacterium]|nr:response regulator [Oligoflexia bacterium]